MCFIVFTECAAKLKSLYLASVSLTEHFGVIDYKQNLQAFQRGIPARWRLKPGCYEWDADTCLIQFVGKDLYTLMEKGTLRVKRLAKNHRTLTAAGTQSQCIRSGV